MLIMRREDSIVYSENDWDRSEIILFDEGESPQSAKLIVQVEIDSTSKDKRFKQNDSAKFYS